MHLAVEPEQRAIGIEHGRRIVIKPGGAALEERRNNSDSKVPRELAERFGGRPWDRLGKVE